MRATSPQAGLDELAIEWWGKAGEQALRRSAFSEAVSHLRKAIEIADSRPAQTSGLPEIRDRRLKLHADYALAVAWATGYTSDRTTVALTPTGVLTGPGTADQEVPDEQLAAVLAAFTTRLPGMRLPFGIAPTSGGARGSDVIVEGIAEGLTLPLDGFRQS